MSAFDPILRDLRERRLWPVALVLLAALVAVPVTLSKSGQAAPPPPAPTPSSATASAASACPRSASATCRCTRVCVASARDPFAQQQATAAAASTAAGTSPRRPPAPRRRRRLEPPDEHRCVGNGRDHRDGRDKCRRHKWELAPCRSTPSFPTAPSKPAPAALTATQSYRVTVAITNAVGGLDTIDPLQRLSGLPSDQLPLLIELGVLKGGHRALFLVQPGTVLSGPGAMHSGTDRLRNSVSLAPNQIETISTQSSTRRGAGGPIRRHRHQGLRPGLGCCREQGARGRSPQSVAACSPNPRQALCRCSSTSRASARSSTCAISRWEVADAPCPADCPRVGRDLPSFRWS